MQRAARLSKIWSWWEPFIRCCLGQTRFATWVVHQWYLQQKVSQQRTSRFLCAKVLSISSLPQSNVTWWRVNSNICNAFPRYTSHYKVWIQSNKSPQRKDIFRSSGFQSCRGLEVRSRFLALVWMLEVQQRQLVAMQFEIHCLKTVGGAVNVKIFIAMQSEIYSLKTVCGTARSSQC